jgi:hypothetical protein
MTTDVPYAIKTRKQLVTSSSGAFTVGKCGVLPPTLRLGDPGACSGCDLRGLVVGIAEMGDWAEKESSRLRQAAGV